MKILITAGSTRCPIDKVRAITNIFSGRTGFSIATEAVGRGHSVTFLGNSITEEWLTRVEFSDEERERFKVVKFKTFNDLELQLKTHLEGGGWDVVIQSAAVSDYRVDGVFQTPEDMYDFLKAGRNDMSDFINNPRGKISSKMEEMYLRLVPTTKLVDRIREWGLGDGKLVKFKLEVGVTPEELFDRASASRADSDADLIVANRLDDFKDWEGATIQMINRKNHITMVSRKELPKVLMNVLES